MQEVNCTEPSLSASIPRLILQRDAFCEECKAATMPSHNFFSKNFFFNLSKCFFGDDILKTLQNNLATILKLEAP